MKFYIASRTAKKDDVLAIYELIKEKGHEISYDWTSTWTMDRPYEPKAEMIGALAHEEIQGILNSDIFVIISDEKGTGMYIELGAAIAKNIETGSPKIYTIGEHNNTTVFHFLSCIKRKNDFSEVLEDLKI